MEETIQLCPEQYETIVPVTREMISIGGGGVTNFDDLSNRPKYNNQEMTSETNIPIVPTVVSALSNDSKYQTDSDVASTVSTATAGLATKDYVDSLVGDIETALHAINNGGSES